MVGVVGVVGAENFSSHNSHVISQVTRLNSSHSKYKDVKVESSFTLVLQSLELPLLILMDVCHLDLEVGVSTVTAGTEHDNVNEGSENETAAYTQGCGL